jgi:membrane protease YdiL (CAAX protease family)
VPLIVVRLAYLLDAPLGAGAPARVFGWAVLVFVLGWMIVFPLWTWRRRGGRARGALPRVGRVIREFLLALPFLLLVFLVLVVVAAIVEGVSGQPTEAPRVWREAATTPGGWRFVAFAVTVCVLGPAAEEVFFRWFLFRGLRKWWGGLAAALGQAALFALYHPSGVKRLVVIFVAGLMLQKIYLWRRTLLAPVFVHALFNVSVLAIALYVASQPRPYLGVRGNPDAPNCVIEAVMPGSAAAEAGLRVDDVITSLDGQPVTSFRDLKELLRNKDVGDRVGIGILRNGQAQTLKVVLGSTTDRGR